MYIIINSGQTKMKKWHTNLQQWHTCILLISICGDCRLRPSLLCAEFLLKRWPDLCVVHAVISLSVEIAQ